MYFVQDGAVYYRRPSSTIEKVCNVTRAHCAQWVADALNIKAALTHPHNEAHAEPVQAGIAKLRGRLEG